MGQRSLRRLLIAILVVTLGVSFFALYKKRYHREVDAFLSGAPSVQSKKPAMIIKKTQGSVAKRGLPISGDFSLKDTKGQLRTKKEFLGRPLLIYLGYSYCPDICPMALDNITQALEKMGQGGKVLQPIFISLDPDRDTSEQLKSYMKNFHPTILALRAEEDKLKELKENFKAFSRKVNEDGVPLNPRGDHGDDYLIDHSSIIYLFDKRGRCVAHFNHLTPPGQLVEGIRKHLK